MLSLIILLNGSALTEIKLNKHFHYPLITIHDAYTNSFTHVDFRAQKLEKYQNSKNCFSTYALQKLFLNLFFLLFLKTVICMRTPCNHWRCLEYLADSETKMMKSNQERQSCCAFTFSLLVTTFVISNGLGPDQDLNMSVLIWIQTI